jgi:hypothetical protein
MMVDVVEDEVVLPMSVSSTYTRQETGGEKGFGGEGQRETKGGYLRDCSVCPVIRALSLSCPCWSCRAKGAEMQTLLL